MTAVSPAELLAALPFDTGAAFLVFARVGSMIMAAPALGDAALSPRLRLALALAVTAVIAPNVLGDYPPGLLAADTSRFAGLLIGEIAIGVFLGLFARVLVGGLSVAGQIIALQMGLSLAQIFNPSDNGQGAIVGGFLTLLGAAMIFATDAHYLLFGAIRDSYVLMAPGASLPIGDMSEAMTGAVASAFSLGVRLASPFIVFGVVFYAGAGVLSRMMPQAQVFFMLAPANLMLGLTLLMLTTGLMMTAFLSTFEDALAPYLR